MQQCFFCGHLVQMVHVHGHYQCSACKTNAMPCCDGDNCETNYLFKPDLQVNPEINEPHIPFTAKDAFVNYL